MSASDAPERWGAFEVARVLATYLAGETARELAARTLPPVIDLIDQPHDWVYAGQLVEVTVKISNYDHAYVDVPGHAGRRDFVEGEPIVFPALESGRVHIVATNALNSSRPVEGWSEAFYVMPIPAPELYTPGEFEIRGLSTAQFEALARSLSGSRSVGLEVESLIGPQPAQRGSDATAALFGFHELVAGLQRAAMESTGLLAETVAGAAPPASLAAAFQPLNVSTLIASSQERS